jgi:hypothetical protein
MPLITVWRSNPEIFANMSIEQVLAMAGDGKLRDDSVCSTELRSYLAEVPSSQLATYAEYCLTDSFPKSGMALQDVINELGRRLDFEVTNGRYQGSTAHIGNDGLWRGPEGNSILVEVKTTDAYRISLDTIARYRDRLRSSGDLSGESSMLLVVGREDTGDLEAQVRGSKHAWDMRLISVGALVRLARLKESTEEPSTAAKIRSLLVPMEYTRLDGLIDVLFATATDVETALPVTEAAADDEARQAYDFTSPEILKAKREQLIAALERKFGTKLVRKTRAMYWDAEHQHPTVFTLSKRYDRSAIPTYWYAYHPAWDEFLASSKAGRFVLGGVDLMVAFAVPVEVMREHLAEFNQTTKPDGSCYWHIKVKEATPGHYQLLLSKSGTSLPLDGYALPLASESAKL